MGKFDKKIKAGENIALGGAQSPNKPSSSMEKMVHKNDATPTTKFEDTGVAALSAVYASGDIDLNAVFYGSSQSFINQHRYVAVTNPKAQHLSDDEYRKQFASPFEHHVAPVASAEETLFGTSGDTLLSAQERSKKLSNEYILNQNAMQMIQNPDMVYDIISTHIATSLSEIIKLPDDFKERVEAVRGNPDAMRSYAADIQTMVDEKFDDPRVTQYLDKLVEISETVERIKASYKQTYQTQIETMFAQELDRVFVDINNRHASLGNDIDNGAYSFVDVSVEVKQELIDFLSKQDISLIVAETPEAKEYNIKLYNILAQSEQHYSEKELGAAVATLTEFAKGEQSSSVSIPGLIPAKKEDGTTLASRLANLSKIRSQINSDLMFANVLIHRPELIDYYKLNMFKTELMKRQNGGSDNTLEADFNTLRSSALYKGMEQSLFAPMIEAMEKSKDRGDNDERSRISLVQAYNKIVPVEMRSAINAFSSEDEKLDEETFKRITDAHRRIYNDYEQDPKTMHQTFSAQLLVELQKEHAKEVANEDPKLLSSGFKAKYAELFTAKDGEQTGVEKTAININKQFEFEKRDLADIQNMSNIIMMLNQNKISAHTAKKMAEEVTSLDDVAVDILNNDPSNETSDMYLDVMEERRRIEETEKMALLAKFANNRASSLFYAGSSAMMSLQKCAADSLSPNSQMDTTSSMSTSCIDKYISDLEQDAEKTRDQMIQGQFGGINPFAFFMLFYAQFKKNQAFMTQYKTQQHFKKITEMTNSLKNCAKKDTNGRFLNIRAKQEGGLTFTAIHEKYLDETIDSINKARSITDVLDGYNTKTKSDLSKMEGHTKKLYQEFEKGNLGEEYLINEIKSLTKEIEEEEKKRLSAQKDGGEWDAERASLLGARLRNYEEVYANAYGENSTANTIETFGGKSVRVAMELYSGEMRMRSLKLEQRLERLSAEHEAAIKSEYLGKEDEYENELTMINERLQSLPQQVEADKENIVALNKEIYALKTDEEADQDEISGLVDKRDKLIAGNDEREELLRGYPQRIKAIEALQQDPKSRLRKGSYNRRSDHIEEERKKTLSEYLFVQAKSENIEARMALFENASKGSIEALGEQEILEFFISSDTEKLNSTIHRLDFENGVRNKYSMDEQVKPEIKAKIKQEHRAILSSAAKLISNINSFDALSSSFGIVQALVSPIAKSKNLSASDRQGHVSTILEGLSKRAKSVVTKHNGMEVVAEKGKKGMYALTILGGKNAFIQKGIEKFADNQKYVDFAKSLIAKSSGIGKDHTSYKRELTSVMDTINELDNKTPTSVFRALMQERSVSIHEKIMQRQSAGYDQKM